MGNRLYVGNLPFDVTADALRAAFDQVGEVTDAHVVTDRETGRSRGFGFVTMSTAGVAATALDQMNGSMLGGRALRVDEAAERAPRGNESSNRDRGGGRNRW